MSKTLIRKICDWLDSGRRAKEDAWGFQEWLRAGAKHSHHTLVDAFTGKLSSYGDRQIQLVSLGNLTVGSGEITVQDLSDLDDSCFIFDEKIPAGNHKVDALFITKDGLYQIAALRLQFGEDSISHLEPTWSKYDRITLEELYQLPEISIDSSAVGALLTSESLLAFKRSNIKDQNLAPKATEVSSRNQSDLWRETGFQDGTNIFSFIPGHGGGRYWCFFAKTSSRVSVALIADFGFLGQPQRIKLNN